MQLGCPAVRVLYLRAITINNTAAFVQWVEDRCAQISRLQPHPAHAHAKQLHASLSNCTYLHTRIEEAVHPMVFSRLAA